MPRQPNQKNAVTEHVRRGIVVPGVVVLDLDVHVDASSHGEFPLSVCYPWWICYGDMQIRRKGFLYTKKAAAPKGRLLRCISWPRVRLRASWGNRASKRMPEYTEPLALPVPRPPILWSASRGHAPSAIPKFIVVLAFPNQSILYAVSPNFILPSASCFCPH